MIQTVIDSQTGLPNQNEAQTFRFDSGDVFEAVVKFSTYPAEIIFKSSRYQSCLHDSPDSFSENRRSLIKMEKSWSSLIIGNCF